MLGEYVTQLQILKQCSLPCLPAWVKAMFAHVRDPSVIHLQIKWLTKSTDNIFTTDLVGLRSL